MNVTPEPTAGTTRFLTSEAVHVDIRVARVGSRVAARLIDVVVQIIVGWALSMLGVILVALLASVGLASLDGSTPEIVSVVAFAAAFIGYPALMERLTNGRTAGKMVVGLRVVRTDGGPITFRHAFTRALVGLAIEWPGVIGAPLTWLVSLGVMVASPLSQRLGDHAAGTLVVHERTPSGWGWVPNQLPELAGWAATLDLTGVDDDLALAVRQFLSRNRLIREPARTQLGLRLAREVAAVTNPPPPAGTPGWAYLAAVHAERHRRAARTLTQARGRTALIWPQLARVARPPVAATGKTPGPAPDMPGSLPLRASSPSASR